MTSDNNTVQRHNNKERSKTIRNLTMPCINLSEYWTSMRHIHCNGLHNISSQNAKKRLVIFTTVSDQASFKVMLQGTIRNDDLQRNMGAGRGPFSGQFLCCEVLNQLQKLATQIHEFSQVVLRKKPVVNFFALKIVLTNRPV